LSAAAALKFSSFLLKALVDLGQPPAVHPQPVARFVDKNVSVLSVETFLNWSLGIAPLHSPSQGTERFAPTAKTLPGAASGRLIQPAREAFNRRAQR
jgi:hypothetical protein